MTADPLSFFTIDLGTASTAAALVAPCEDRFRVLASTTAPAGVDVEALLEDLSWRVARSDPGLLGDVGRWREWARIECRSVPAPGACLVAATPVTSQGLAAAFAAGGWRVAGAFAGPRLDALSIGELCLDARVAAVAVGVPEGAGPEERAALPGIWDLVTSLAAMRDDLVVVSCGPVGERPEGIAESRVMTLPPPDPEGAARPSALSEEAIRLAGAMGGATRRRGDSRQGLRASVRSLAALLDRRVDGVEVGVGAGSRTVVHPAGELGHLVAESAALAPASVLDDDAQAEEVFRWSAIRGDPLGLADRLRNLRLAPWRDGGGDGSRLRLAALRGALSRLSEAWKATGVDPAADVIVVSGGAFSAVPPPAAALVIVDTLRRSGAVTLLHDHAGVLGPIGMLPDEGDRRRLLADLLDDALLPLGSAILTGDVRSNGRGPARMVVRSVLAEHDLPLVQGDLRLVDLPPGITARVDIESPEATVMGIEARRLTLEVSGGLAGLVVDTRDIPLRLPEAPEGRREALESWDRLAWMGATG